MKQCMNQYVIIKAFWKQAYNNKTKCFSTVGEVLKYTPTLERIIMYTTDSYSNDYSISLQYFTKGQPLGWGESMGLILVVKLIAPLKISTYFIARGKNKTR